MLFMFIDFLCVILVPFLLTTLTSFFPKLMYVCYLNQWVCEYFIGSTSTGQTLQVAPLGTPWIMLYMYMHFS